MKIIDGKAIAQRINEETKQAVSSMEHAPKLVIVLASSDFGSEMYVELKKKKAEEVGIEVEVWKFEESISKEELLEKVNELNTKDTVNYVLIQLPFYPHLDQFEGEIVNTLNYRKDADGLTAFQQGLSSQIVEASIPPATVEAVLECLNLCFEEDLTWSNLQSNWQNINSLKGKNILVVNNSNLIGKPLANILSTLGATVTIANENTQDLIGIMQNSDIVVTATGKTNLFDDKWIKDEAIIIDVTSTVVDGKAMGDFVQSELLLEKVAKITPVPGGVGPLTVACLLRNVVRNYVGRNN